jgi:hypothetical protein
MRNEAADVVTQKESMYACDICGARMTGDTLVFCRHNGALKFVVCLECWGDGILWACRQARKEKIDRGETK